MANHNLTHHEELRYNYLMRNYNYLSPKEQEEFNYLRDKVEAFNQAQRSRSSLAYDNTSDYQVNDDTNSWYQNYYQDKDADYGYDDYGDYDNYEEDEVQYTASGLPLYDDGRSNYQSRRARKRAQREAKAASQVDQGQNQVTRSRKPRNKRRWVKRTLLSILALVLLVFAGMGYKFYKGLSAVNGANSKYKPAIKEKFNGEDADDGTNILILGSDQRVTQGSTDARTDSIMVVNVGNSDNRVKMVSFMRDTLINIYGVSADSYTQDQKLNTAFNLGEQDGNQGAEYMRQALKDNFGLKIKYYVMLDFETFAEAVDTLFPDGVEIDAKFATVDGQKVGEVDVPDDLRAKDGVTPQQTIKVGKQKMDGRTLLNYSRFRHDDEGDFGRTKRQQQVMKAIVSQVKNPTKLFTGSEAIGKVFAMTSTNMPYSFLFSNGASVMSDASKGIKQKTMPENGDWVDGYDMYGGQGLSIDFDHYRSELKKMGMR
ncbi:LCP family protein [Streptococcus sobrinus]|uniref:Regulatory protein MsrR n=5 Tax=Streptococcus sobrinus TaxID=1310 RepID=U2J261_9STRE|nr:LCP family protein [Streptococcus sobrinus]ERJ74122.1 cell envelope-like function transcriptional attenuator common domain protein [Streptococcus sobrinus W1703]